MINEKNQTAIQVLPSYPQPQRSKPSQYNSWRLLPAIAKWLVIAAVTMALLGVEVELRLSPQLDVLLVAAGLWLLWI